MTDGRGVDIVLDAVGGPGFAALGDAVAPDGTLVSYGRLDEQPILLPRQWPLTVHGYVNLVITGDPGGRHRAAHHLGAGLTDGTLRPVIAEVFYGLDRITDAHRLMESDEHTGKIVVRI
ncbi:zinc-binding dehydrogenase [Streptomyces flaveolus]|uniref:zinc-binding dehydrogenase n=1 Tax=Streptomyces flaveolus TaxID=67297 RepID=UPI003438BFC1